MGTLAVTRFSIASVLLAVVAGPATGQAITQIGDRPSCTTCSIELRPLALLSAGGQPALIGPSVQVAINSRGQFAVSSSTFSGQIFVYAPDGRFLRAIGRRGEAPAEFAPWPLLAFDPQDSLHAIDINGSRYVVLTPGFEGRRFALLRDRVHAFVIDAAGSLFAAVTPGPGSTATALRLFSRKGEPIQSFDPIDPPTSSPRTRLRSVAVGPGGDRWSMGVIHYRIQRWNHAGQLIRTYEGKRDWLSGADPQRLDLTRDQPPAALTGLAIDERGWIWVYAIVPDENWRPMTAGSVPNPTRLYDTIIEVIDGESGALLTRSRVDPLVAPAGSKRAFSVIEVDGHRRVQIWEPRLSGR